MPAREQAPIAGLPWFRGDDYETLREVIEDPSRMSARFEDWEREASRTYAEMVRAGVSPVKAYVDPATFLSWCAEQHCPANTDSLKAYADEIVSAIVRH